MATKRHKIHKMIMCFLSFFAANYFAGFVPFVPVRRKVSLMGVMRKENSADTAGAELALSLMKCRRLRAWFQRIQSITQCHIQSPKL